MAGCHHGHGWRIKVKLRKIGHRAEGGADIPHLDPRLHQTQDQRVFDRERIVAVIIGHHDLRADARLMHLCAKP